MTIHLLDAEIIGVMLVAGFASGLAGFAFSLIASGTLFLLLPPLTATPLVVATSIFAQLFTVFAVRRQIVWSRLWPFVLGGLLGTPIGTALLRIADPRSFRLALGTFLIVYSLAMLFRGDGGAALRAPRAADGVVGFAGGVLGGLAGVSGALPTAWCALRGWNRNEQRAIYQPYIVVMQVTSLLSFTAAAPIPTEAMGLLVESLPAVLAGLFLGLRLYRRVDEIWFRRIILGLLLLSGLGLVV